MNVADVIILLLLAFADMGLMVVLRRWRRRVMRAERMVRSLQLHIQRELACKAVVATPKRRLLRAS